MKKYLVALDQGTTSSRAIVFDRSQQIVASAQKEFPQLYPQAGWVEHDPLELYSSQYGVMMEAITRGGIDPAEIAAIGITNQRETTIVWEKATGRPIYPAIVWQCRRTAALCDRLRADGLTEHIRAVTGLVPDAYFSATKIRWILDHVPGAQERAERGELLFGTVDSWLVWKLTRGRVHATDVTNASRTMLFDIRRLDWDETLLQVLRIPRCMLPDVRPSSGDFGTCNIQGVEIPIAGAAGDQQAALFGQCCFAPGEAKNTYGTGCFLLMNTGETPCVSRHGLVTTIAAGLGGYVTYALEGSVFVGGAVIQWLRDEMRFLSEASDAEYYAQKVDSTGGVYFVPAFTGLARRIGICTPAGPSSASRAAQSGSTSSALRRNPSPTRAWTSSPPWRRTPACRCASCASTAVRAATPSSCSSRRTCWPRRCAAPSSARQRPSARRIWPGSLSASGTIRTSCAASGGAMSASCRI